MAAKLLIALSLPFVEIAVFIVVGGEIGVAWTLAITFATAVGGLVLLRVQGFAIGARVRAAMDRDQPPVPELLDAVGLAAAAVFLLIPGFITDLCGLALAVPPLRRAVLRAVLRRLRAEGHAKATAPRSHPTIIEGDYVERRPDKDGER